MIPNPNQFGSNPTDNLEIMVFTELYPLVSPICFNKAQNCSPKFNNSPQMHY